MGTLSRGLCDSITGFQLTRPNLVTDRTIYDPRFIADSPAEIRKGPSSHGGDDEAQVECDYFDGVYDYIKQMLMEEDDLEHRPCMFQDCSALQAAEKYFFDALNDKGTSAPALSSNTHADLSSGSFHAWRRPLIEYSHVGGGTSVISCDFDGLVGSPEMSTGFHVPSSSTATSRPTVNGVLQSSGLEKNGDSFFQNNEFMRNGPPQPNGRNVCNLAGEEGSGGREKTKKTHGRGDDGGDCGEEQPRSSKQLVPTYEDEEPVQMEKYDKTLLCRKMNPRFYDDEEELSVSENSEAEDENKKQYKKTREVKRGRPKGSKKNRGAADVAVDLSSLLTRCAEAVSSFNIMAAEKLLKQIRIHSSPYGNPNERLAHCFANALEARMTGTGSALYAAFASRRMPAAELLRSYQAYVAACPFKRMSNIFANKSIAKHTREADRIHIIDFGILYGFQWPCIIQGISLRPGGPPRLKITGIDYPQPGFRPAERVEQTGRRLASFCERFNVPFEYNVIAKSWEHITIEDLKIENDEMVVVNCLYRMRHVPDESSMVAGLNNPPSRDVVLKLIKKINPHLFIHGIVNGTCNVPFFGTRFREALFHYSTLFDMMETTLPREDQDRLLYEREVFGREVMNVVACEGLERVERPETYRQWQVRNQRAGFRLVPLEPEIVREVRMKVRKEYQSDFLVDEDGEWVLQGWRGRVMYALSCWKPTS